MLKHFLRIICLVLLFFGVLHADDSLRGTWMLSLVDGSPLPLTVGEERPFMSLDPATQKVDGFDGCNRFQGNYSEENGQLKFGPLASTRRLCADDISKREQKFYQGLELHDRIQLKDNKLLMLKDEQPVLLLIRQ